MTFLNLAVWRIQVPYRFLNAMGRWRSLRATVVRRAPFKCRNIPGSRIKLV